MVGAIGYTQKDRHTDRVAIFSRSLIGDENTARIESWYFNLQDKADRLKYRITGGSANPFGQDNVSVRLALQPVARPAIRPPADVALLRNAIKPPSGWDVPGQTNTAFGLPPARPAALVLPETRPLHPGLEKGEGVWTTDGLPHSSPADVLMAKTFVKPDRARPYASVGVLLVDKRRVRLHITGGTQDPGGDLGVKGPGVIPEAQRKDLLAAWNGGFRGPHGGFGMYADGKQYRPLRNGLASVAVMKDGSVKLGQWGRDLTWSADIVAVRQNAVLLVDNCEVSKRTSEGNDTWGYVQVNSAEFITWRSAIGLTREGNILVAAGNSLSADSLARALWAAGACYAMQLDINTPYVLISLFNQQNGALSRSKFMDSMADNPGRFLSTQANDFMYLTLDESNYHP